MNIVLTGFMATGKSEISRAISRLSDYEYIDTDKMIVEAAGKSIQSIFDEDGEAEFRRIEKEVISRAAELDGYVVATGGGVVLDPDNIDMLRKNGIIVNLAPEFEVIRARLKGARRTRPLLQGQTEADIKKRFDDRQPFYDNCDIKIKVTNGKNAAYFAREILKRLEEMK